MNQHLQNILNLLDQNNNLSLEEKNSIIKSLKDADKEFTITEFKLDRTEKVKKTTAVLLEETIEELEKKRKDVEAQNRELEIEASLERVRTVAMSMMKPDDLLNICKALFNELKLLGFSELRNALINTFNDEQSFLYDYDYSDLIGGSIVTIPYNSHPLIKKHLEQIRSAVDAFAETIVHESDLKSWKERRRMNGEPDDPRLENISALYYYFYSVGIGAIGISTFKKITDEQLNIIKRFRNVFDLAYKRYVDITNAEAQARESQIQLALERVRARAMAMQTSEELNALIGTVFTELTKLDIVLTRCVILIYEGNEKGVRWWMANSETPSTPMNFFVKYADMPFFNEYLKGWYNRELKWQYCLEDKNKIKTDDFLFNETELSLLPDFVIEGMKAPDRIYLNASFNNFGNLTLATLEPLSEEHFNILLRFAKVFDLTYTRFNDLQKAEAQARESQIQLALERVRARTMAMQKSDELTEAALLLFEQLQSLGAELWSCGFNIWEKGKTECTSFIARGGKMLPPVKLFLNENSLLQLFNKSRQKGEELWFKELSGEDSKSIFGYVANQRRLQTGDNVFLSEVTLPSSQMVHLVNFSHGNLMFITLEPHTEFHNIFKRFGKVFEQTYTRFLDLKKAEAQAREAQIEAALEKVRSRSLAVSKSSEFNEVIKVVFERLQELEIPMASASINVFIEGSKDTESYICGSGENGLAVSHIRLVYFNHPIFNDRYDAYEQGLEFFTKTYSAEEKNSFYEYEFKVSDLKYIPADIKKMVMESQRYTMSYALTKNSMIVVNDFEGRLLSAKQIDIVKRFSKVFEQAYTRFLDLQKAEAQARESQIQLALERVRARTMAMQKSAELKEVIQIVYEQFVNLNINIEHTGFIIDYQERNDMHIWLADQHEVPFEVTIPYFDCTHWNSFIEAKEKEKNFFANCLSFDEKNKFYHDLFNLIPGVPDETKKYYLSCAGLAISTVLLDNVGLYIENFSGIPYSDEENKILMRFGKVFQQTYTRFLDLQKAEAQAREAQIEAALEKVRSRSLVMHKSDELFEVVTVVSEKLVELGVAFDGGAAIVIFTGSSKDLTYWIAGNSLPKAVRFRLPYFDHPMVNVYTDAAEKGIDFFDKVYSYEDKNSFYTYAFEHSDFKYLADDYKKYILESKNIGTAFALSKHSAILTVSFSNELMSEQRSEVLKRFSRVFEQAYTRFLDLQKAEAQAREAQIEAALERVRARTMAMQKSEELNPTAELLFDQLKQLGAELQGVAFAICDKNNVMVQKWTSIGVFSHPYTIEPGEERMYQAWKNGEEFYEEVYEGEKQKKYYEAFMQIPAFKQGLQKFIDSGYPIPTWQKNHAVIFKYGYVLFITTKPFDETQIFLRFGKVFEQTYTRFLDLQKAEEQARESQIQLALERVRARTMAMQKSNDLFAVAEVLWEQLKKLGQKELESSIIHIYNNDLPTFDTWYTYCPPGNSQNEMVMGFVKVSKSSTEWAREVISKYQSAETEYTIISKDKKLAEWYRELKKLAPATLDYDERGNIIIPEILYYHFSNFSGGSLLMISITEPSPEACDLHKRAAMVFDLAYTRFLDLQKAEAQARESQIEAALERVRGKAMAMYNSNDVSNATAVMFNELSKLGVENIRCGIGILHANSNLMEVWMATETKDGHEMKGVGLVDINLHTLWKQFYNTWQNKKESLLYHLKGDDLKAYYKALSSSSNYAASYNTNEELPEHYCYVSCFEDGGIVTFNYHIYTEEQKQILKRFATVFSLTYKRYKDLQSSEINAREAIKQAALDRIRADIASMRTINDLDRITPLIWNELTILGVPFIRCGVFIMDDANENIHTFLSTPDGKAIAAFHIPYNTPGNIKHVINHWRERKNYIDHWGEDAFTTFAKTLVEQGALTSPEQYLKTIPHGGFYLHFLPFLQGMLYVGNTTQLSEDEINLIQSLADAFSTAYARYEDFNKLEAAKQQVEKTLTELKQTQQQLVQSEKMASLGELTAGIAHEIQNPLNFVNNFSEVNEELLIELVDEFDKGNAEEAKAIVNDIKLNLEKINHHGKRADAIVKGMLQHSRKNTGEKEPTDINALCDEYLRLSYHGLRAKDKSFNADFKTEFDNTIGKINIVPQDIGRVLLNLFNNAFYAVSKPPSPKGEQYKPLVTVTTRKIKLSANDAAKSLPLGTGGLEIIVHDNGNGIPQNIIDKIFQPFFTTKPTGQGTGLGLSLAYDIITKEHNGTIKVESKEGEGSTFIISLPA